MAALRSADFADRLIAGFFTSAYRFLDQDATQAAFGIRSLNLTAGGTSGLACEAMVRPAVE